MKYTDKIAFILNEKKIGKEYIVMLKYGWCFRTEGNHVASAPSVSKLKAKIRCAVPCKCWDCENLSKGWKDEWD